MEAVRQDARHFVLLRYEWTVLFDVLAVILQDSEEVLVDLAERRRGICGLVHVEAPSASATWSRSSFAVC